MTYSGEIYPTETRTQAYGLFLAAGRLGTVLMPFMTGFWHFWTGLLPEILFGILFGVGCLSLFKLKDSLNRDMEEIEEDSEFGLSEALLSQMGEGMF